MKTAFLLCALLGLVLAQKKSFSANVAITDPTIPSGTLNGKMFYNPNLPAPSAGKQRIDFSLGVQEFFEFSTDPSTPSLRFLVCPGQCQTETVKIPFFIYFGEAADTVVGAPQTINGRSCTQRTKTGNAATAVKTLFLDAAGFPCRATFGNGKVIDFLTVDTTYNGDPSLTPPPALDKSKCPKPTCNKQMDIDLVFDESGSIDGPSFAAEVQFARDIANSFTFGTNAVQMALEQFSTTSRHTINLTPVKQNFLNGLNSVTQAAQRTCCTCGILQARAEIFGPRARPGVAKFVVILTDGVCNERTNEQKAAFDQMKADGVTIASIGVGNQFNPTEVQAMASNPSLFFSTPSFQSLSTILNTLIQATCDDLPASLCPATCKGFCSCGGVCLCPDQCNPTDACKVATCPNPNTGCIQNNKVCNSADPCLIDSCNPATGCVTTNTVCNDNTVCTTDVCVTKQGCRFTAINCNDNNACTTDGCNAITGCTHTTVNCNDNNACTADSCNPATGCVNTPINCDDSNKCTIDSCNPLTGCVHTDVNCNDNDPCTDDSCVPATGCRNTPKVCTPPQICEVGTCDAGVCKFSNLSCDACLGVVCNAPNPCVIAKCVDNTVQHLPGTGTCVFTNVTCDDSNRCTIDTCNVTNGQCVFTPVVCPKTDCFIPSCNPANGQCVNTAIVCNDNNNCTVDTCSNDVCSFTPVNCPPIPCKVNQCDPSSGKCIQPDKVCNSNNKCIIDSCNPATDACETTAVNCDDNNACTTDTCNPLTGCVNTPVVVADFCTDNNACTLDTCDIKKGCEHKKIDCAGNQTDACLSNKCDPVLGCQYAPLDCSQIIDRFKQGNCQLAVCKSGKGCVLEPIPGATIDPCGFCVQNGKSAPFCFLGLGLGQVAGIAGGVIAAIVIAVVAAVAIAAISGKVAYNVWAKNHANNSPANVNPLFQGNGQSGVNTLYTAKA